MRASGILLPVFSLPGKYGVGCFSREACGFIDKLQAAGQKYWQILPLGHAGGWYSPYQPLSCFAVDPLYIDLEDLKEKGLLKQSDLDELCSFVEVISETRVPHRQLIPEKMALLKKAFAASSKADHIPGFQRFRRKNRDWLSDYALFVSLSEHFGSADWSKWPRSFKRREPAVLNQYMKEHKKEISFFEWLQFTAHEQWHSIRKYAHEHGIDIIGDIPIYAAYESADCWADPQLFKLTPSLRPEAVSGCPPDAFSEKGQVWGNPLYKWRYHKQTGYSWWISRLAHNFSLYDVIRLDHFRGFESFFSIPAKDETAENGRWMRGPGMAFFDAVSKALPDSRFIAEDLGFITPAVNKLIQQTGLPGMKVLQFAFDGNPDNPYLPENYTENCVAYSGTHDNDTTAGWYGSLDRKTRKKVTAYLRSCSGSQPKSSVKAPEFGVRAAVRSLVAAVMISPANTCIIPLQDYLLYDSGARINTPGTTGDNWCWRMRGDAFDEDTISYILSLTKGTGRFNSVRPVTRA